VPGSDYHYIRRDSEIQGGHNQLYVQVIQYINTIQYNTIQLQYRNSLFVVNGHQQKLQIMYKNTRMSLYIDFLQRNCHLVNHFYCIYFKCDYTFIVQLR